MVVNLNCLIEACKVKHIYFSIIDEALIQVNINDKLYYFFLCQTPLNSQDVVKIAKDKAYTYLILHVVINMPKTIIFFNPNVKSKYKKYVNINYDNLSLLIKQYGIEKYVVKMNQGQKSKNIFFCNSINQIYSSLNKIFNIYSKDYDYIALIQEYIEIKDEYRLIYLNRAFIFGYNKKTFKMINDINFINKVNEFVKPIFEYLDIKYCGIDLAVDLKDIFYLLEINTAPGFSSFVKKDISNKLIIVDLYSKILDLIKYQ